MLSCCGNDPVTWPQSLFPVCMITQQFLLAQNASYLTMSVSPEGKSTALTIWHKEGKEDEPAWEKLDTYQIKRDMAGNYSVLVPAQSPSWYHGFWDILSSTLYECKVGVSYIYPHVQFSMMCQAVMQENAGDSKTFGLAVICYRTDKKVHESLKVSTIVGGSLKPKMVRPGTVRVRLASSDFEADTLHGEDPTLSKQEADFRGRDFEKQFACRYKRSPVDRGVFGKVYVESIHDDGHTDTIFEFNLARGVADVPNVKGQTSDLADTWSLLAIRELAVMLRITDDENWRSFAKQLGFTEQEIRTKLAIHKDPFSVMLGEYQQRGGTPEEFVQALYDVSRKLSGGECSPLQSQSSSEDNLKSVSAQNSYSSSQSSSGSVFLEDDDDVFRNSDVHTGTPVISPSSLIFPQTVPLTPPHTPRKRKKSVSEPGTPVKLTRKLSDDSSGGLVFTFEHTDGAHRECQGELSNNILWQLSQHVNNKWKSLGRNLNVQEDDLMCIEHAHRDMRECSYQAMLKWKEMYPQHFTYGVLYTALCDSGLKFVAQKHCIVKK